MPAINSIPFISLRGLVQPITMALEDISRPGVDGQAFRQMALRSPPFEMLGVVDCDDFAAARSLIQNLGELQGGTVSVTDDFGSTFDNVMLLRVAPEQTRPALIAVGGVSSGKGAILTVRLQMQFLGNL